LFEALDATTRTLEKTEALERYFAEAPARDAAWALYFLLGEKLPRSVTTRQIREWAAEEAGLPEWLMEECYEAVGDLAETASLVLENAGRPAVVSDPQTDSPRLHALVEEDCLPLVHLSPASRRERLGRIWRGLDLTERFVFNKLMTGNFRVGVARTLVARALSQVAGTSQSVMLHRLMGHWKPTEKAYVRLLSGETTADRETQPYPFYLASPLEDSPESLAEVDHWQFEWKWDGIRAQLIRRGGPTLLWSRGGEPVADAFPEIADAASHLPPGTVLDGEVLAWRHESPLPFGHLQKRLGRKSAGPQLRAQVPVTFMAYDLLEQEGTDVRERSLAWRRAALEDLLRQWEVRHREAGGATSTNSRPVQTELAFIADQDLPLANAPTNATPPMRLSPTWHVASWEEARQWQNRSRSFGTEGLMIKQRSSPYGAGRPRGAWWKWKIDPFTVDAVLVAAQPGHGRRAGLFTDYTFALWNDSSDELVTVAKAYSGLTDQEIEAVDRFVRQNTTQRFGPVRGVKGELVFELAFEGLRVSTRHKAGVALRFPRIHRWRRDKKPEEADTLGRLRELLRHASPA
jgi:DNA ligase-1